MPVSYRCADASDQRTEPMLATASRVRGWVLVEVRGAWGEGTMHCSTLAEHVPADWKDQLKKRTYPRGVHPLTPSNPGAGRSALRVRGSPTWPGDGAIEHARRADRWQTSSPQWTICVYTVYTWTRRRVRGAPSNGSSSCARTVAMTNVAPTADDP